MNIDNIVSYFDGISCGQVAINKAGIKYKNYFAFEIDKHAINVTQDNYPNTIQMGSVVDANLLDLPNIDLLIGGSPCQGFSQAGKKLDFDDPRSKLFFEYAKAKEQLKPKYFIYENVVPKNKEVIKIISDILGVQPIMINSSLVSYQERKRLYWTNIKWVEQPKERNVFLKDIVGFESEIPEKSETIEEIKRFTKREFNVSISKKGRVRPYRLDPKKSGISEVGTLCNPNDKSATIIASHAPKTYKSNPFKIYELNRNELEQGQNLPINYTKSISFPQAKKAIGNGWTVDIIAHFFGFIN